jgi:hypothetical protein
MIIGGLAVKCSCCELGCEWIGELSDLTHHEEKCKYKSDNSSADDVRRDEVAAMVRDEVASLFKVMTERMDRCDADMEVKDKDISHLKFNLEDVKTELNLKINRMDEKNKELEEEVKLLKANQQDIKQVELKVENLTLKNIVLEQKVEALESQ